VKRVEILIELTFIRTRDLSEDFVLVIYSSEIKGAIEESD